MKKPEATFWDWLSRTTGSLIDFQRHEDMYSVGIPDLSYGVKGVNGWIELKAYTEWPTGKLPHYTAKQANWLTQRGAHGGSCFILIRFGDDIAIFSHQNAIGLLNAKGAEIPKLAFKVWKKVFSVSEFIDVISGGHYA